MALPGQGKDYQAFQQDDAACRQSASSVTGGSSQAHVAPNGEGGSPGDGGNAPTTAAGLQQAYDMAYVQCIYSRGDTVQPPSTDYAGGYPPGYPPPNYYGYPPPPYYYGYPPPYYYGYAPPYFAPSIAIGVGGGWGWGGGGGWHGHWR
jgi:hypothetical protein